MATKYVTSLNETLDTMLDKHNNIHVFGEDIVDPYGGAFQVTEGLSEKYPEQINPTPISEATLGGMGIGMSLRGLRPIIEIMFGDFVTLCADQIINHAAKFHGMFPGDVSVPLVIRTPMGGGRGYGPTHSQNLEKIFLGTPHLRIVAPSHFHDPGKLLRYSTLKDDNPTLFIEHKLLYSRNLVTNKENDAGDSGLYLNKIQNDSYPDVVIKNYQSKKPDVLIVSYGGNSRLIEDVMTKLITEEIRIWAYLPSCISSPNLEPVIEKTRNCQQVLTLEESTDGFNWSSEISSRILSRTNNPELNVKQISAKNTVIPAAQILEEEILPTAESLEQAVYEALL